MGAEAGGAHGRVEAGDGPDDQGGADRARRAWVRVHNSGDAIAADDVEALFEPFRRAAPDRTSSHRGVGLGLSIVRAVAATHSGRVRRTPRPEAATSW